MSIKVDQMALLLGVLSNFDFQLEGRQMKGRFLGKDTAIEFKDEGEGIVVIATGEGGRDCLAHLKRCHEAGYELPIAASATA